MCNFQRNLTNVVQAYMAANSEIVAERNAERGAIAETAVGARRSHEVSHQALGKVELTPKRRRVLSTAARQVSDVARHRKAVLERGGHRRVPEGELARL